MTSEDIITLERHEGRLLLLERAPGARLREVTTATVGALAAAIVSLLFQI